jgi:hypothetical protein
MSMQSGRISFAKPLRVCHRSDWFGSPLKFLLYTVYMSPEPYTQASSPLPRDAYTSDFSCNGQFIFFCWLVCKLRRCCETSIVIQHPFCEILAKQLHEVFSISSSHPQTHLHTFIIISEMNRWFSTRSCHVITHFRNLQIVQLDFSESAPSFSQGASNIQNI